MSAEESTEIKGKLIIKGLPFETNKEDLCTFLDITDQEIVELVPWHDNPERCKGHGFIHFRSVEEAEAIKAKSGLEFEAAGNCRRVKIEEFVAKQGKRSRRKNSDEVNDDEEAPVREQRNFTQDDESKREVYVSNLSFQSKEEDVLAAFGEFGEIEQVTIPKIYSSGRPKGFAFVRFATEEQKDQAIEALHGSTLNEREIGVRANKGRANGGQRKPRKPQRDRTQLSEPVEGCTTIYVGNLPWKADEDELVELFSIYGAIKNTRVVRKSWTAKSRGFGYVEFEETSAMEQAVKDGNEGDGLESEGRQLRIDYAEPIYQNATEEEEEGVN